MTKVINKKALMVLLTLVLAFCWLSVPASAAEVKEGGCIGGDVATPQWGGYVYNLTFESLDIYACKYDSFGRPHGVDVNGAHPSWTGSNKGFFCYLTEDFYQGMTEENLDKFYCTLWFNIEGSEITKYEVLVNDTLLVTKTKDLLGDRTCTWICPKMPEMDIVIKVYTLSGLRSSICGRVIPEHT